LGGGEVSAEPREDRRRMMAEKIKPCPFCGSEDLRIDADEGRLGILCRTCSAWMPAVYSSEPTDRHTGLEGWNRRAPDPAIGKARDALRLAAARMERLLAEQTHCGDLNWECPLHDAHKDYDIAGELPKLREALALLEKEEA
jgi:Lar family restriction alleviation protein